MDNITTIFKEKKLKLTPQRIAVYKYLKSTKEHPSAEMIYKSLQIDYPTMSLATVYKALKTLVEVGLVQEINVGEGNFRYDANYDEHAHIQCLECFRVDDLETLDTKSLNAMAVEHSNYKVMANKIYFYGVCSDCQENSNNQ